VARFLSAEWIEALDRALAADGAAAQLPTPDGGPLVVEQRITPAPAADGAAGPAEGGPGEADAVFHVVLGDGKACALAGPAPAPTLRFTQDRDTAWSIATGRQSAQAAFMTGRLQVGGDLRALLDERFIGILGDAFAAVRAETTEP
jgi:hypothetical protein